MRQFNGSVMTESYAQQGMELSADALGVRACVHASVRACGHTCMHAAAQHTSTSTSAHHVLLALGLLTADAWHFGSGSPKVCPDT